MNVGDKVVVLNRRGTPDKSGVVISGGGHSIGDHVIVRQVAGKAPSVLPGKVQIGDKAVVTHIAGKAPVVISPTTCPGWPDSGALINGDWEDLPPTLSPWYKAPGFCAHTETVGAEYKHSGDYGLRQVYARPPSGCGLYTGLRQDDVYIEDGDWCRLWTKNITDEASTIEFLHMDPTKTHYEWSTMPNKPNVWQKFCFPLTKPKGYLDPGGPYRVYLWIYNGFTGTTTECWRDDVAIIRAP